MVVVNGDEETLAVVDEEDEVAVEEEEGNSTGFLERLRPRCICRSQYFESGYASFEHLHFFPSVLLHLPGSISIFLPPI